MNLQFLCQRSASRKKRFDFQRFSHAADAKTPLPSDEGSVRQSGASNERYVQRADAKLMTTA
jgi:hypothetical protein